LTGASELPLGQTSEDSPCASKQVADAYELLLTSIRKNLSATFTPADYTAVERAYHFAVGKHQNQVRHSGEPYITHPLEVASILTELHVDGASIVSAILHDTVEDTDTSLEEIQAAFGGSVSALVDGLTKIGKIEFRSSQEKLAENFRKMIIATAKDLRVVVIKLCDRLHNMRTIECLPQQKRQRISRETLDIYAPLANRLGIYNIKSELEDLCLKEMHRDIYQMIRNKIASKRAERAAHIDNVKTVLEAEFHKYGFQNVSITGRPKHFFSIYKKMVERSLAFEDVHDLFAFRIIVESIKDCYEALGIVHALWKPMPGRFKDYIAMPKANMYQSLHTTVIRPNGEPAEIQIRTYEMHHTCEFGIAAHWAYKEGTANPNGLALKGFAWLRQIMEMQSEIQDPDEFLESVKVDLFDEEIFVFTPKCDVIQLSQNATALDYAFAIHTNIGLRTTGSKINGRLMPIKTRLKNGDIVEIITSKNQNPKKDWLNFAQTSKARHKIRSFLRSEQREKSKTLGRELLEQAFAEIEENLDEYLKSQGTDKLVKAAKESHIDDIYISLGYGKYSPEELLKRCFGEKKQSLTDISHLPAEESAPSRNPSKARQKSSILVNGISDIMIQFAGCCTPLPGDPVVGYITRGEGVSVHRTDCRHAYDLDPQRKVQVSWASQNPANESYGAFLQVITRDKPGVLADVTSAISSVGVDIKRASVKISPDQLGILDFEINVRSLEHLNLAINKVEALADIVSAQRKAKNKASVTGPRKSRS
jgi:guanosine-3',5'-bis(diphosphate) 3'-pyrophosphohydrolase